MRILDYLETITSKVIIDRGIRIFNNDFESIEFLTKTEFDFNGKTLYSFLVYGTYPYNVRITKYNDYINYGCDCPYSDGGIKVCKHIVAASMYIDQVLSEIKDDEVYISRKSMLFISDLERIMNQPYKQRYSTNKNTFYPLIISSSSNLFKFALYDEFEDIVIKLNSTYNIVFNDIYKSFIESCKVMNNLDSHNYYSSLYDSTGYLKVKQDIEPIITSFLKQFEYVYYGKTINSIKKVRLFIDDYDSLVNIEFDYINSLIVKRPKKNYIKLSECMIYSNESIYLFSNKIYFTVYDYFMNNDINDDVFENLVNSIRILDQSKIITISENLKLLISNIDVDVVYDVNNVDGVLTVNMEISNIGEENKYNVYIDDDYKLFIADFENLGRKDIFGQISFHDKDNYCDVFKKLKKYSAVNFNCKLSDFIIPMNEYINISFDYIDGKLMFLIDKSKKELNSLLNNFDPVKIEDKWVVYNKEEHISFITAIKSLQVNLNTIKKANIISRIHAYTIMKSENTFIKEALKTKAVTTLFNQIIDFDYNSVDVPIVNATPRHYQVDGFKFLKMLDQFGFGGILADDMGLGKTLQTLMFIKSFNSKQKCVLIIAPTSVVYNWEDEIMKFTSDITYQIIGGSKSERRRLLENYKDYQVILTSYALLRRDNDLYEDLEFDYIFFDEGQYLKNIKTATRKIAKSIKSPSKFILSGTPIENNIIELYSLFDLINENSLGEITNFKRTYKDASDFELSLLRDTTKNFILRRHKSEVLKELPKKIETIMYVTLNTDQKKMYNSFIDLNKKDFTDNLSNKNTDYISILTLLTRLRQISCHPKLVDSEYNQSSDKYVQAIELIDELILEGRKIIIFSQFKKMLDILSENIKYKHCYLHGGIKQENRPSIINDYQNGDSDIILISLRAGATGINLTKADTVIIFDPWWNPQLENQAIDRAHRIGQVNNVNVIRLVAKDTIEEKIIEMQVKKRELVDKVIENNQVNLGKMNKEEILSLFTKV